MNVVGFILGLWLAEEALRAARREGREVDL